MFQFVLVILVFFSAIEVTIGKRSIWWFNIAYTLMTLMAMFRFGQMSDYFNYYSYYLAPDYYLTIDPLYGFLMIACQALSMTYPVFVAFMSFTCMALAYRFFYKDCGCSCLSLLIFYSYTFLTCPMSGIRQGICLSLLLFMYHFIREKQYKWFFISVIVGSFIHLSFIICIIIPLLMHLKIYNNIYVVYVAIGLTLFALAGIGFTQFLPIERLASYDEGEGVNIVMRMALRCLIIIPILLYNPEQGTDGYFAKAICIVGYAFYCILSFNDQVAARLEFYFRTFTCLYAGYMVANFQWKFRIGLQLVLLMLLHTFLWIKNIDTEIKRWDYKEGISFYNFPYISVFNKSELKNTCDINTFGLENE